MCGILGIYSKNKLDTSELNFKSALSKLDHRGPDNSDVYFDENYYLGHTRLSIIDLSKSSNQPFISKDKKIKLVFNGEIYNYQSLRLELSKTGVRFETDGDVEVLLEAYRYYGEEVVKYIEGMFAFAIIDEEKEKLFLARDHFGKKPLFYTINQHQCIFASEINPILQLSTKEVEFDLEGVNHFLALGYVLQPKTLYKNIEQLEASTTLTIDLKDWKINKKQYFHLEDFLGKKSNQSLSQASDQLSFLLQKSISKRMIGDVPCGMFLSGGIDSSTLAYQIQKNQLGKCNFYSFSFEESDYDESSKAALVAKMLSINLEILKAPKDIQSEMERFIQKVDYIPADNAIFPLYFLAQKASLKSKFVLTGDGADEIFGGYSTYQADRMNHLLHFMKIFKNFGFVEKWSNSNDKIGWRTKAGRFILGADKDYQKAHYQWRQIFNTEERLKILGTSQKELIIETDPFLIFKKYYHQVKGRSELDQHLFVDMKTWLSDNILVKSDRATMMAGVEARSPFLDIDLVKFAFECPDHLKKDKLIVRNSIKNSFSSQIVQQSKSGFNSPIGSWMNINENEFKWLTKFLYQHYEKRISSYSSL